MVTLNRMKELYFEKMKTYIDKEPNIKNKTDRMFNIIEKNFNLFEHNKENADVVMWGFRCGEGWYGLIEKVLDKIQKYLKENLDEEEYIQINTIKEKFGGLRIYLTYIATEERKNKIFNDLNQFLIDIENESFKICEECADVETARIRKIGGFCIKTLCDSCFEKIKNK